MKDNINIERTCILPTGMSIKYHLWKKEFKQW
jgi:hypothetical protein